MINTISKKAYLETYIILKELELLNELPDEVKQTLINNKANNYEFSFNQEIPLYEQIEDESTKTLISYLYLKYINKNQEEKNILLKKYKQNEINYQKEIQEKYSTENLFKNKKNKETFTQAVVKYKEKNFFQKIIDKIRKVLKRSWYLKNKVNRRED